MKKLFTLFISLVSIVAYASDGTHLINGIYYYCLSKTSSNRIATVTYLNSPNYSGDIVIPSTVENGWTYTVTSVGSSAFANCVDMTSISLPNTITSIEGYAFSGCSGLSSLSIPSSVTTIKGSVFKNCSNITSITIPSSVISIQGGDNILSGCSSLTQISVENGNTEFDSRDNCNAIIRKSDNHLLSGCKNTVIPNTVLYIDSRAFSDCIGLTNIDIPSSVTGISAYAFYGCTGLTSISIPSSVQSLGEYTFTGCTNLISADLSDTYSYIPNNCFAGCTNLTTITYSDSKKYIGSGAFRHCNNLKKIIIKENITGIGTCAFADCPALTTIINYSTTPQSITVDDVFYNTNVDAITLYVPKSSLEAYKNAEGWKDFAHIVELPEAIASGTTGDCTWTLDDEYTLTISGTGAMANYNSDRDLDAPWWTYSIKKAVINEGVTSIGNEAFYGCTSLSSVSLPNSITSIGLDAFAGSGITSINIPNQITEIGERTFYQCRSLQTVNLPSSITNIGKSAFDYCAKLSSINLSNTIQTIGECAFEGCTKLSINLPTSLTAIGAGAFWNTGLTSIDIPNTISSIEPYTFKNCKGLKSVTIPNSVTDIKYDAFLACTELSNVTMSNSIKNIEKSAFEECSSIESIVLPNTLISIGEKAFNGCSNLKSVDIPSTVTSVGSWAFSVTGLTDVSIPSSISKIEQGTFDGCNNLATVFIPASVISIGSDAFSGCTSLTSITCLATTPPSYGTLSFDTNIQSNATLYVPSDAVSAYQQADGWKEFTYILSIPTNALSMNNATFLAGSQPTLPVYMDNSKEICNLQFDVVTPSGIGIYYGQNDDEEDVYWVTKGERAKEVQTVSVSKNSANTYRVVISSSSNAVFKDDDKTLPIANIKLDIDKTLAAGSYDIQLKNIILNNYNSGTTTEIQAPDVTATITIPPTYTIAVSSADASKGTVKVSGDSYEAATQKTLYGSSVTLTATPATGYHFVDWTENNSSLSTDNPYTLSNVSANHTITASFEPNTYKVTFTVDGETYSEGQQTYGQTLTLPTAPTKTGYTFTGWMNVTSTTTVPANDVTYAAVFTVNKYTVKFIADGVTVSEQKQDYNSTITAPDAPAKEGYAFVSWGDVAETVPANDVTYTAEYVLIGDLSGDNKFTVTDLTNLVGIILTKAANIEKRVFKTADIYVDNKINVADYTSLVGMILKAGTSSAKANVSATNLSDVSMLIDNFRMSGTGGSLCINLNDPSKSIAALQFDIELPAGICFNEENFISKYSDLKQSVSYKLFDDNLLRVMVYSPNNSTIKTSTSTSSAQAKLMDINLSSIADCDHSIIMKNIVCATADNSVRELSDIKYLISPNATNINDVNEASGLIVTIENGAMIIRSVANTTVKVVNLAGAVVANRSLSSGSEMRLALPVGTYIVNGTKYAVK